ncbi:unnamed protein product [Cunninghamella echinulata]
MSEQTNNVQTSEEINQNSTTTTTNQEATPPKPLSPYEQDIKTLQEAFPDIDKEVIDVIYSNQNNNLNATFDTLLSMSNPNYQPSNVNTTNNISQQEQDNEALARQLAEQFEEEQRILEQRQQQQQQQQQQNQPTFNLQEELPIIKERVIEAGNVAKKKFMNFYNSFMEQGANNSDDHQQQNNQNNTATSSSIRGDGLVNDMRGLRVSDKSVNPPIKQHEKPTTITPEQQMLDDEAFARRLALEDAQLERLAAQRQQAQHQQQQSPLLQQHSPQPFSRPITHSMISQHEDDNDEDQLVTLTAPNHDIKSEKRKSEESAYVIKDEDDDDDLLLVDEHDTNINDLSSSSNNNDKTDLKKEKLNNENQAQDKKEENIYD